MVAPVKGTKVDVGGYKKKCALNGTIVVAWTEMMSFVQFGVHLKYFAS